jgi:hypothetical protein
LGQRTGRWFIQGFPADHFLLFRLAAAVLIGVAG